MNCGILAMGEGLAVALIAAQMLFNIGVGVLLAYLASRRADDRKVKETVDDIRVALARVMTEIGHIHARLSRGDDEFDATREGKQKLELKTQDMITQLRVSMATREDLEALAREFQNFRLAAQAKGGTA